jgi:hypothetical protein
MAPQHGSGGERSDPAWVVVEALMGCEAAIGKQRLASFFMRSDAMPEITFLRDLEAELREIAERDAAVPRSRVTRRAGLVTVFGAVLAAVVAFALVGDPFGGSGSRLDAAAKAAVAPPN